MVPLGKHVKAEMVMGGSEKTDYRNLRRVGSIVHIDLFDRRGQKREDQLQGGRLDPPGECMLC
jgi:hypothetical protein